jgi:hypothetical protein
MTEIKVIVTGPEETYDYEAELWCANELMAQALAEAEQRLAAY